MLSLIVLLMPETFSLIMMGTKVLVNMVGSQSMFYT